MDISIYFDKNFNVVINPAYVNTQGVTKCSKKYILLKKGWTKQEFAEAIMSGLKMSKELDLETGSGINYWTAATGIKGYATFSKRHRCVSVYYIKEKDVYNVVADRRFKDGSYGLNKEDIERRLKTYSGQPSIETIADQVLEALEIDITDDNREL